MYNLVGTGFDVHAVNPKEDASIMLCGVAVPSSYEIIAHSDGDVALHALADAILGAIGGGDIGEHFPPSDDQWKDANSELFIQHILKLMQEKGGKLLNVDITIIAQAPRVGPYKAQMKENLARMLAIDPARVNVKATTTERLGYVGRKEGIAAQAVCSVAFKDL
jgi:2-C-methyl-D-erythritol 4-phosphate cytidylyltransferase/2-C-methyl-D-erythritol 2,4-cyclodiphosphate synthase